MGYMGYIMTPRTTLAMIRRPRSYLPTATIPSPTLAPFLFPLPLVPSLTATLLTLSVQNSRLLCETFLHRQLSLPVKLSAVRFHPFQLSVSLHGLNIADVLERPLLNIPMLSASLRLRFRRRNIPPPRAVVALSAPSVELVAVFDGPELARSSWPALPSPLPSSNATPSVRRSSTRAPRVRWTAQVGETLVSIRQGASTTTPKLPTVRLPGLHLRSEQVADARTASQLAQDVVARAVTTVGVRAFPRAWRAGARRWARDAALTAGVGEALSWGEREVRRLRKGADKVDRIAAELPEATPVRVWASRVSNFLKGLEEIAEKRRGGGETEYDVGSGGSTGSGDSDSGSEGGDMVVDTVPLEGYRELDEDYPERRDD